MNNQPFQSLMMLSFRIKEEVIKIVDNTKIKPLNYTIIECTEFEYNDLVCFNTYTTKAKHVKKFNSRMISLSLIEFVKKSYEYRIALKNISIFTKKNPETIEWDLRKFIDKISENILSNIEITDDSNNLDVKLDDSSTIKVINSFLMELKGKPVEYELKIELTGIILRINKIKIDNNVILRRPIADDITKGYISNFREKSIFNPSAILSIKLTKNKNSLIEPRYTIEYLTAFFKLFKVGNVKSLDYSIKSDSIEYINSIGFIHRSSYSAEDQFHEIMFQKEYKLTVPLVNQLRIFIENMDKLGLYIFDKKEYLHINVAYEHYKKALSSRETNDGIFREDHIIDSYFFERRINETIMGLEALFSGQGGAYGVRMRIATLFNFLLCCEPKFIRSYLKDSYDPEKIDERIKDGYFIRNKFAHGSRPDSTSLNRKYDDLDVLLMYLLDYLRISIIIMHFNDRKELLNAIDKAMIKKDNNLTRELVEVKKLFLLNNVDLSTEMILSWIKKRENM